MADTGQDGQLRERDERCGDFAVRRRRRDLVGVAENDRDRSPNCLQAFRIEALDEGRSYGEGRLDARDAEIVLGVIERGDIPATAVTIVRRELNAGRDKRPFSFLKRLTKRTPVSAAQKVAG